MHIGLNHAHRLVGCGAAGCGGVRRAVQVGRATPAAVEPRPHASLAACALRPYLLRPYLLWSCQQGDRERGDRLAVSETHPEQPLDQIETLVEH